MWRRWWNGMLLWCAASGRARVRLSELCHPAFRPRHSRASPDSRPAAAHATAAATARSPKHRKQARKAAAHATATGSQFSPRTILQNPARIPILKYNGWA